MALHVKQLIPSILGTAAHTLHRPAHCLLRPTLFGYQRSQGEAIVHILMYIYIYILYFYIYIYWYPFPLSWNNGNNNICTYPIKGYGGHDGVKEYLTDHSSLF